MNLTTIVIAGIMSSAMAAVLVTVGGLYIKLQQHQLDSLGPHTDKWVSPDRLAAATRAFVRANRVTLVITMLASTASALLVFVGASATLDKLGTDWVPGFLKWLFYFGVMLAGMAGQYMWGLKKTSAFKFDEFIKPIWISILIFGPLWSTVANSAITFVTVAAAYQNGFFWKVILESQSNHNKVTSPPKTTAVETRNP